MTLNAFISLPQDSYKILSYFYIIIYENWIFNIKIIDKNLNISIETFFKTLYLLKISDIINFQINEKELKIFLTLGQSPIDLKIEDWPNNLLNLFNKIVFQNRSIQMDDLIIKSQKGLDTETKELKKKDAKKLRKHIRKIQENKAKEIFNYFYKKYKKTHFIFITEKLKEEEIKEAKELCFQYPQFSVNFFKEGIDWFLDHKFHNSYIVNIEKLRKNFSKFLKEYNIIKFKNEIRIQ